MKTTPSRLLFALASTAIVLAGCGGGGGGSTPAPAPAQSNLSKVPVTVIDGVITNAVVCLDKNLNGACDTGEPSGRTDTSGNVILQVDPADVGKYPILALVGTDAVDADHGPVTQAFVMKAPADETAVVSPLTTLVQSAVASTGASTEAAAAAVQAQLGINVSLFDDFTKSTSTDSATAGVIARLVVVATQEQTAALASALGSNAMDGTVITQADIDKAIEQKMLQSLTAFATAAPAIVAAATPEAKAEATAAAAEQLVAASGLTATSVATVVAINNQAAAPAPVEAPTAAVILRQLNFTNANNWFARAITASVAQNTPDASGNTSFVDRRARKSVSGSTGDIATWGFGGEPRNQANLHWNGASWVACALNAAGVSSVRDAQGRSTTNYCDNLETSVSTVAYFDVAGRKMLDVYNEATNSGYGNVTINSADSALGTATFPAGAKVGYHTLTALTAAPGYYPGLANFVVNTNADVAAGKTTAENTTAACASITSTTPSGNYQTRASTLESIVAANPGTPCVYGPGSVTVSLPGGGTATVSSGPRNDWWGQSSVNIGSVGTAPVGGTQTAYYTTNTLLRAAFSANNTVTYLSCKQRSTDGSPRNCDAIGTGTYAIATLGDARVMTLTNSPASMSYNQVFVERGGKVYNGSVTKPYVANTVRLNREATNALFTQLGGNLPMVDPETPLALRQASYQGEWVVQNVLDVDDPLDSTTIRLFGNGAPAQCFYNKDNSPELCQVNLNPATGAVIIDFTNPGDEGQFNGTLNFMTGEVVGTFTSTDGVDNLIGARRNSRR